MRSGLSVSSDGLDRGQRPFGCGVRVDIAHLDADLRADIVIGQRIGRTGRTTDGAAITQPLISERAQTVGITDTQGTDAQHLILDHRAGDRRQT